MFTRENETVALAVAEALDVTKNDVVTQAMRTAVETFATMYGHHIAPSQAWQLYALYNQVLLVREPTNHTYLNEMMACHTRAGEEIQHERLEHSEPQIPQVAPPNETTLSENDAPPAPVVLPTSSIPVDTPLLPEVPTIAELPDSLEEEARRKREEDAAWEAYTPEKKMNSAPVIPKPDEVILEGKIVKEWRNLKDHRAGYWRRGFPYRIVVSPQQGQHDAPEYYIHCAHKPTLELFSQHATLYKQHLCYVRVKYSNGEESTDITKEYVEKLNNPAPVGRTEMQEFPDDEWTEDAPWRIRFHDVRVDRNSYVYFEHEPGAGLLKKYHRVKHHAVAQSRVDWIADAKAANI